MGDEFPDYDYDTPTEADLDSLYGTKYLGTVDVGTKKIRARIAKITKEEFPGKDGKGKKTKVVLYFDSLDKGLVVNATIKDVLVDRLGRVPAEWKAANVGIFVDPNVSYGGKRVGGVRLTVLEPVRTAKAKPPKPKPASKQQEDSEDPSFDPELNDSPDFNEAA